MVAQASSVAGEAFFYGDNPLHCQAEKLAPQALIINGETQKNYLSAPRRLRVKSFVVALRYALCTMHYNKQV
jgi:hypothetical protein